jgi:Protein of unknown function (DUF3037)
MQRTRALYSVMQYIPDDGRAEAANVGVVLFFPATGAVEVRVSASLSRVKQFFTPSEAQLQRIADAVASARSRLERANGEFRTEEAFARFVASRADAVRLTAPRVAVVTDPDDDISDLYAELVGDTE